MIILLDLHVWDASVHTCTYENVCVSVCVCPCACILCCQANKLISWESDCVKGVDQWIWMAMEYKRVCVCARIHVCVHECVRVCVWLTQVTCKVLYCAQTSLLNLTHTVNHQTSHSGNSVGTKRGKIGILQRTKVSIMVWRRQGKTRPSRTVWESQTYSLTVCFFLGVGMLGIQGRGTLFLRSWWHVVPQSVYVNGMESGRLKQG